MAFQTTKVCEHCGYTFEVPEVELWAYKRVIRMPGDYRGKVHWFCKWSCMEAAQKKSDAYYDAIQREQRERTLAKKREYERERHKRWREKKRDGTRCKAETSCADPDNKRKEENLSPQIV